MEYQSIIDRFYPAGNRLRDIFLTHSRQVAQLALQINYSRRLGLDPAVVEAAAMLHDIGIFLTHAPSIECRGTEPYIRHGILGAALLRAEGVDEKYARVAERHTGSGLSASEIEWQGLPLPHNDYLPETLLEKLICYADKFYSKSGSMKRKDYGHVRASLAAKSEEAARRLDALAELFGLPDQLFPTLTM